MTPYVVLLSGTSHLTIERAGQHIPPRKTFDNCGDSGALPTPCQGLSVSGKERRKWPKPLTSLAVNFWLMAERC